MGEEKKTTDISHGERENRRIQILYSQKTLQRTIFMNELRAHRKKRDKKLFNSMRDACGPRWYQALSVGQRAALDDLDSAIYQDLLSGRPLKTPRIMKELGLYPRPNRSLLMSCIYLGRDDSKEMLSQLYYQTYGYPIEGKRMSYTLNARLMLSAILYLGMENLIHLLREKFRPDTIPEKPKPKPKPKPEKKLKSPYLENLTATYWQKPVYKRPPPPPLPNLDDLNEPYEEEPVMQKPPPPPPPPPPPKKRIPRSVCDELAGVNVLEPYKPSEIVLPKKPVTRRKGRSSKVPVAGKKVYGIGINFSKKGGRRRKPVPPSTGLANSQYTINGVYQSNGKSIFILGNVAILPAEGDLIHGGFYYKNGQCIVHHCGYRGFPPPSKLGHCDCQKEWHDSVMKYLKNTKCYCDHHFDYGNEGSFPSDELPYFIRPTRNSPMKFNYHTIFDLDEKQLHVERDFKRIWDTDSILHVDDGTMVVKDKKKKKKRSSKTCLGDKPSPSDYLRCALRYMRRQNIAARLPDLHLVPELIEWMRKRMYGPLSKRHKAKLLYRSNVCWQYFTTLASKGYGHVIAPKDPDYVGFTNWLHKKRLNDKFNKYVLNYRISMYRSHAFLSNLLWRSMFQAELPDKQFRAIYFSYLFGKLEDVQVMQPYNRGEVNERKNAIMNKRVICPPDGAEDVNN